MLYNMMKLIGLFQQTINNENTFFKEITMTICEVQFRYFLKHRLAIKQVCYCARWIKNSNFWMCLPIFLSK